MISTEQPQLLVCWSSRSGTQYCNAVPPGLNYQACPPGIDCHAGHPSQSIKYWADPPIPHYYYGTPGFSTSIINCFTDLNCIASHLGLNCYVDRPGLIYSAGPQSLTCCASPKASITKWALQSSNFFAISSSLSHSAGPPSLSFYSGPPGLNDY